MERITINLDLEPKERWLNLKPYKEEINILINTYLSDLKDVSFFGEVIEFYKQECISPVFLEELSGISLFTDFNVNDLLIANLYYDALKLVIGCSAFSVNTKNGNLHARNLDWWSDNNSLKDFTKIFDFKKKDQIIFSSIGWPGFIGVFSGFKPKKYAITLNAVLSQESAEFAIPITFKIREVLEQKNSFSEALDELSESIVASDCLLLLTGLNDKERVVIERTPKRSFIRKPNNENNLVVTNDYLLMDNRNINNDVLQSSSCGRRKRVLELLNNKKIETTDDCLNILSDDKVKMNITMQQMVFLINKGEILLKI